MWLVLPAMGKMPLQAPVLTILAVSKVAIGAVPNNIKRTLCDYISKLICTDPEQSVKLWCPLFLDITIKKKNREGGSMEIRDQKPLISLLICSCIVF